LLLAKPEAQVEQNGDSTTSISVVHEVNTIKLLFEAIALEQNKSISIYHTLEQGHLARFEKSHFKQVIINILKNSFEALPKMGKIKIKIDEKNRKTRIRILDNGRGIARERLSRIGEPYYTNKEKGTGIGLTICFKLIADYGGQMKVKSKIGWGTVVTITLEPVAKESVVFHEESDGRSTVV
jgi:signal transduction histidine kinase